MIKLVLKQTQIYRKKTIIRKMPNLYLCFPDHQNLPKKLVNGATNQSVHSLQ